MGALLVPARRVGQGRGRGIDKGRGRVGQGRVVFFLCICVSRYKKNSPSIMWTMCGMGDPTHGLVREGTRRNGETKTPNGLF